jgi:hypothetical protein
VLGNLTVICKHNCPGLGWDCFVVTALNPQIQRYHVVINSKMSTLFELQYTRNTNQGKHFFFTGVMAEDGQ